MNIKQSHQEHVLSILVFIIVCFVQAMYSSDIIKSSEQAQMISLTDKQHIRAFVDHLKNKNVKYYDHEVHLFAYASKGELIFYGILTLFFSSCAIILFLMKRWSSFLQGLVMIGIGIFLAIRTLTLLNQYSQPKPFLQLTEKGIVRNNILIVDWKNIKRIETNIRTIFLNGFKVGDTKEIQFIDQSKKVIFSMASDNLLSPILLDDFLFLSKHFMKCQGINV